MKHFLSAQEKAAFVTEYLGLPYGTKLKWLAEKGVGYDTLWAWRAAYLAGDLERGAVPRDTAGMRLPESAARIRQLEQELAAERAGRAADAERLQGEVERLQGMNDALGTAIGLLHETTGEPEPTDES